MKQIDIVDYLIAYGCETKRIDKRGYYVMCNPVNGKITAVPVPKTGNIEDHLMPVTIGWICKTLDITSPDIVQPVLPIVEKVRKDHGCD